MNQPPNFNRLAGLYRWMEWASFGPWLGWCRCAFLTEVSACRNAVVFGDGDGRFTARLLAANPTVQIEAVDASAAMLVALARRAGPHSARVRSCRADARTWQPNYSLEIPQEDQAHDLIVTHFFLDCLTTDEVRALATNVRRIASPSALWLVSEFAIPATLFGRVVARPLVSALYFAFALLTGLAVRNLPDYHPALRTAGFTISKRRIWLGGLLISELWSANAAETAPDLPPRPF
jgi:ubiquinone/menaquinone biosynthesis C-methylase UbiE